MSICIASGFENVYETDISNRCSICLILQSFFWTEINIKIFTSNTSLLAYFILVPSAILSIVINSFMTPLRSFFYKNLSISIWSAARSHRLFRGLCIWFYLNLYKERFPYKLAVHRKCYGISQGTDLPKLQEHKYTQRLLTQTSVSDSHEWNFWRKNVNRVNITNPSSNGVCCWGIICRSFVFIKV